MPHASSSWKSQQAISTRWTTSPPGSGPLPKPVPDGALPGAAGTVDSLERVKGAEHLATGRWSARTGDRQSPPPRHAEEKPTARHRRGVHVICRCDPDNVLI